MKTMSHTMNLNMLDLEELSNEQLEDINGGLPFLFGVFIGLIIGAGIAFGAASTAGE